MNVGSAVTLRELYHCILPKLRRQICEGKWVLLKTSFEEGRGELSVLQLQDLRGAESFHERENRGQ